MFKKYEVYNTPEKVAKIVEMLGVREKNCGGSQSGESKIVGVDSFMKLWDGGCLIGGGKIMFLWLFRPSGVIWSMLIKDLQRHI